MLNETQTESADSILRRALDGSPEFRASYMAHHLRAFLADQIRALRGEMSQKDFGALIGKPQSVVSRLENEDYGKVTLQTLIDIATKLDIALAVRFVDFPTFIRVTSDLSDQAVAPRPYGREARRDIEKLAATGSESSKSGGEIRILRIDPDTGETEPERPFSPRNDNNMINRNLGPAKPTAAIV